MTIDSNNLIDSILGSLDRIRYISPEDIPDIDLYMDQVTTFMDTQLRQSTRYPGEDKVLTKTMINNYAKNNLLPPPIKKKYNKEHMLMLIFIYYYKNVLSINDIQKLMKPITDKYFGKGKKHSLESVYKEVFSLEDNEIEIIKNDIRQKYKIANETFEDENKKDQEFLRTFAFICMLSFDVYVKKLLIEKLIDGMSAGPMVERKNSKAAPKKL